MVEYRCHQQQVQEINELHLGVVDGICGANCAVGAARLTGLQSQQPVDEAIGLGSFLKNILQNLKKYSTAFK